MLSEEIEAVKKYLAHEYQIYTEVTSTRAGKELNESIFQERNKLSEEAVKAISETIPNKQSRWKQSDSSWSSSEGKITLLERKHRVVGRRRLIGRSVSLDRKLGLLASAQQGLTGVNSASSTG